MGALRRVQAHRAEWNPYRPQTGQISCYSIACNQAAFDSVGRGQGRGGRVFHYEEREKGFVNMLLRGYGECGEEGNISLRCK